jgi:hypothetical protein
VDRINEVPDCNTNIDISNYSSHRSLSQALVSIDKESGLEASRTQWSSMCLTTLSVIVVETVMKVSSSRMYIRSFPSVPNSLNVY